ncbi:hypothetical protein [Cellulomonas sp. URHE0023]|uniref:hypothetical protein n=1 Tax=Cellulomonas sp. URHE0023 TaxID=1380354 RepID=UPI0004854397|nr:hypothetical protein [Cellulomonas sp. URHE0023]
MTVETEYWALLYEGEDISRTHTIVRRTATPEGSISEILRGDGTWETTGIVTLAELNMYEKELRPISATAALDFERWVNSRRTNEGSDS